MWWRTLGAGDQEGGNIWNINKLNNL
jgi:hypothetical protein